MKYIFRCQNCGLEKEYEMTLQEYEEKKNKMVCEECGGAMKRVFHVVNFILKGSGWYKDHLYGITEREMQRNRDLDKKLEDAVKSGKMKYEEAKTERT